MTARVCKWCGADISHRGVKAKFCDNKNKCAAAFYYHRDRNKIRARANKRKRDMAGYPPLEQRVCAHCEEYFDASHARQVYCSDRCRNRAQYHRMMKERPEDVRTKNARWRNKNAEKRAQLARNRRAADPEHHRKIRVEWYAHNKGRVSSQNKKRYWRDPEKFRAIQNERDRRRAAQRALSLLLLPTHRPPEID